jgi:geranylgeranyl transferase type-2 subunit beta
MGEIGYLEQLTIRLFEGIGRQSTEWRTRQATFLRGRQNPDGGFPGREGGSDLYYTGFALRGLAILDALDAEVCQRTAAFLKHSLTQQASVVDFFSLLYAHQLVQLGGGPDVLADSAKDWPDRVAALLETFRTADGGYAKTPGGAAGSTYHTFLVALCYQLLDKDLPQGEAIAAFVRSRRREDGGFVEIAPMRKSGTNPTAAAVALLHMIPGAAISSEESARVAEFLAEMPSPLDGGLRANGRAPLADLLSTFTGVLTLQQLAATDRIDEPALLQYVQSLELPGGGFRGGLWDDATDVEYTFYGLGSIALLS